MNVDPEEDDMESFEINDRDLEFALNPGGRRGLSKNQQLYGIWADREDSDEEEDLRSGFGSSSRRRKNDSAPVSFVSGGIKHGNKIEKETNEPKASKEDDSPIRIERRPRAPKRPQMGGNVFAGLRSSAVHSTVDPEKFLDWAKHSKSEVLLKMMHKMGYTPGQGLGANKQGIVEPVQAVLRPGRAAVGAYGKESKGPKFGESAAESERRSGTAVEEVDESEGVTRRGNWKKSGAKKTLSYQFKTIDEVIAEGGTLKKRLEVSSGIKVIDMTGKEQKVYSGYEAYAAKTRAVAESEKEHRAFDVPELGYNLNALLDLTEESIRRNTHQLRFLEDQTTALENDRNELRVALSKEREERVRMNEVLGLLEGFSMKDEDGAGPSLEKCQELFDKLQTNYFDEYRLFHLDQVAVASVLPLIQKHLSCWDPLDKSQSDYGHALMTDWKKILESEDRCVLGTTRSLENLSPFERLLWDGWMPSMRKAALRWNPRDNTHSMLTVVHKWLPLLPIWIKENLLEQVIIPRISVQVDEWNPMEDHIPIHTWMHPWLEVMGDRLQPVFSPIRLKLARALREWNPTDHSALSMLRPWKGVFAAATMAAFLSQNITPKLEKALRQMDYDPTKNKRYDEFYATLSWVDMLGNENVAAIFVRSFFPKWYETLCMWLETPGVVMEEVALWYNEWKGRFPIEVASFHVVREQQMRALLAMNEAQQGQRIKRQMAQPPPVTPHMMNVPPPPRQPPPPPMSQLSFKDVVEMRARQSGVMYAPQGNKLFDGKRVFTFGRMSIYLDRNVIFAFNGETQQWAPIALDHLLSIC